MAELAKLPNRMVSSNMTAMGVFWRMRPLVSLVATLAIATAVGAQTGATRVAAPRPRTPISPALPGTLTGLPPAPLTGTLSADAARALNGSVTPLSLDLQFGREGSARQNWQSGPASPHPTRHSPRPLGVGIYIPLAVIDAPAYNRGSSTLGVAGLSSEVVIPPAFYPSMEPPVWHMVPDAHPVQGWRVIDVTDVVCDATGRCAPMNTRMLARWAPSLRAYAFRDRVGRIWRVE